MGELGPQQRCLKSGGARVVTEVDVLALAPLAEVAQAPDLRRELDVGGRDRAAVAQRSEVLARIEREGAGGPDGTGAAAAIARAVSLSRVLQDEQAVRL